MQKPSKAMALVMQLGRTRLIMLVSSL